MDLFPLGLLYSKFIISALKKYVLHYCNGKSIIASILLNIYINYVDFHVFRNFTEVKYVKIY